MEAQAAFVGPDGAIHLDAKSAVDLCLSLIVEPRDAEHNHALRLNHALKDARIAVFRVFLQYKAKRFENLLHSLVKLRLRRIFRLNGVHDLFDVVARCGRGKNASTHLFPPIETSRH